MYVLDKSQQGSMHNNLQACDRATKSGSSAWQIPARSVPLILCSDLLDCKVGWIAFQQARHLKVDVSLAS